MATICTECLAIVDTLTGGLCQSCALQRAPEPDRYGPVYRANRRVVLASSPPCHWCGAPNASTVDHLVPVSAGGSDRLDNLVPSCPTCNYARKDTPADEWAQHAHARRRDV